jgi:hypothetical protein
MPNIDPASTDYVLVRVKLRQHVGRDAGLLRDVWQAFAVGEHFDQLGASEAKRLNALGD